MDPGTEYQFQIQAANSSSTSTWSKSSSSTFKTLADLKITNGTYFGTTTLTKGVTYTFKATIKNNASVAWKGGIYLKSGSEDIDKTGLSISAGSSSTVTLSYTPTTTGSKTFTLYYLTNDKGSGEVINGGSYSNPFTVTIQAPSTTPDLSIAGGSYFNTSTLTTGKAYTFAIKVKNNGSSAWNGSFYLKNGSEDWLSWGGITIEAGATKTLTDSYTPKSAGSKTLTLYYQTGNSGSGVTVPAGSYENPFKVTVADAPVVNPTTPYSPSPSHGATGVATSGTFSWSTAANDGGSTLNYDLYVDYNSSFSNVSKPYGSGSGRSCSFSGLSEGKTYYWKVIVYNGSGGHATSPVWSFTTKTASTTKLATPRNLTATSVTSSGFIAHWSSVSGATIYDCYVYKSGESNICFYRSVATTSTDVFGLSPNTSYIFKVRARNGNSSLNSDWSAMSSTVKTSSAGSQAVNLTIFKNEGLANSATITVGQSSHYSVIVKNNGSETWKGSFYLKEGDTDIHPWYGNSIPSTWGQPLECDYTPKTVGSHTLTLYYQTGGRGDGVPMGSITVKAVADPTVNSNLKLKSAIVYPSTIELGKKGTVSATVQNIGSANWDGKLFITDNGIEIASVEDIASGGSKTVYTTSWEPNISGTHTLAVYYKSKGGSSNQVVASNGFINPVVATVTNAAVQNEASVVIISHLTKDVVPKQVVPSSIVYYHFRLLDEQGKQLRGMKLRFNCSNDRGQNRVVESSSSDAQGYAMLSVNTDEAYSFGRPGDAILMTCNEAVSESGKVIPVKGNTGIDNVLSLVILKENSYENLTGLQNVQKMELTFDLGNNIGKEYKGWKKAKIKGNAGAAVTSTFGISFDENGRIKDYSVDGGINGDAYLKFSQQWSKDRLLGLDDGTVTKLQGLITPEALKAGVKGNIRTGFSTDAPADAIAHFLMTYAYNYTEGTSRVKDLAVKTLRKWYEDKQRTDQATASLSFGGNAAFSGKMLSNWPNGHWMRKPLMPAIKFLELGITGDVSYSVEPIIVKETWNSEYDGDYLESLSYEKLSGSSSSVKLGGNFDAKLKVGELWNNVHNRDFDEIMKISKTEDEKTFPSISYTYDTSVTLKHEELFDSSDQLSEVSQSIAFSSGRDISANGVTLGNWKPGSYSAGISNKTTLKSVSKGDWAQFLARISVSDGSESYVRTLLQAIGLDKNNPEDYRQQVFKVFPNLARNTIFCSPAEIYNAWAPQNGQWQSYEQALSNLAAITPNPKNYKLKEACKFQKTITSEFDMDADVKLYEKKDIGFEIGFKGGVTFGITNFPSEEIYFSVPDRRLFTVVQRPHTDVKNVYDGAMTYIADLIYKTFTDNINSIKKAWDDVCKVAGYLYDPVKKAWITYVEQEATEWTVDNIIVPAVMHYVNPKNDVNARHAMHRHPRLAEKRQEDICRFSFSINNEQTNFDSDVEIQTSNHYPAGDLFGVTDQGDTLFVVSEVVNIMGIQGADTLSHAQYGQFIVEGMTGSDDLTPFGFREDQPLDVYYSEEGSEIWHYLGPAGTTLYTDKLGAYMMATSIKNDPLAPVVEATLNDDAYILHIHVSDNIAVRTSSLRVYINGEAREVTMLSESDFEVQLTSKDMDYMMTVFVTANDLAGNQGRLFQMFNMDKPDSIEQIEDGQDVDNTQIHLSKNLLKVENAEPGITVSLFSLKGEMIAKGETDGFGKAQIRLAHLPAGIYVATLSNGKAKKFSVK